MWFYQQLYHYVQASGNQDKFLPVFAEPNLVLFNNKQITALDRAIFYWTFPIEDSERVANSDRLLGSKSYTQFAKTKSDVSVALDSPFNKWFMGDILK